MPVPSPDTACLAVIVIDQDLCIPMPGGGQICLQMPDINVDEFQVAKQLLAQANASIAPYSPVFAVIEVLQAIFDCIKAIPDALTVPPQPQKITGCLPGLTDALNKVLLLLPQFTIPLMVLSIVDALVLYLTGIRNKLSVLVTRQIRLIQKSLEASNPQLTVSLSCILDANSARIQNFNSNVAPINSMMAALSSVTGLVPGLPAFPNIGALPDFSDGAAPSLDAVLSPIDVAIDALSIVRDTVQAVKDSAGSPPQV